MDDQVPAPLNPGQDEPTTPPTTPSEPIPPTPAQPTAAKPTSAPVDTVFQQPKPVATAPLMVQQPITMNVQLNSVGVNGPFPEELRKWSWGGFFLSWLWGIANSTYIAFLVLIPIVNFYVLILLGIKGNEFAWKNRKFESVEQFKKVQRRWAWWGFGVFIVIIILFILLSVTGSKSSGDQDAQRKSNIDKIATDLDSYAIGSGSLPYDISGVGFTEPTDPVTGEDYSYTVSDNGMTGQVCATLSSGSAYCKSVTATTSTNTPTNSPATN